MLNHSLITVPAVLLGLALHWWFGVPVAYTAAAVMSGVWFSREQYWEELTLRDTRVDSVRLNTWRDVLASMFMVFRPMERNLDFYVPVAVAWAMTVAYMAWA